MSLEHLIKELESYISEGNVQVNSVSERGVDWHIDHSLKVIINISKAFIKSDESNYKWKFNFLRLYCLTLGYFPRGKGKAPKVVNNKEKIAIEDLNTQVATAKEIIKELSGLNNKKNFQHLYFGLLNLKQGKRFLGVHTNHHIKIIKDILNH